MKCKDCRWYEREETPEWICGVEKRERNYGRCGRAVDWSDNFDVANNKADIGEGAFGSRDYDGYKSKMIVGEEFGCIHFEDSDTYWEGVSEQEYAEYMEASNELD